MSRWSWHEKRGTRKGIIVRHSDRLTPAQEERQDRERHRREYAYTQDPDRPEHLYEDYRTCAECDHRAHQVDMYWVGHEWLCAHCRDQGDKL